MRGYWFFKTRWGEFSIRQTRDGRWHPFYRDEDLGSYLDPASALDDLVGDHTFSTSNGLDTSRVGLPEELGEWTFVRTG